MFHRATPSKIRRAEHGSKGRIPSLSMSSLNDRGSEDEKTSTPGRKQKLPLADDVFQEPASTGKILVKGFKSKLATHSYDNPYEPMILANGMHIYPWDSDKIRNFLELEEDEEIDKPGAHEYVCNDKCSVRYLTLYDRLLQRLYSIRDKECEVIASMRLDPEAKAQMDEDLFGPVYADVLRTPPMMCVFFL